MEKGGGGGEDDDDDHDDDDGGGGRGDGNDDGGGVFRTGTREGRVEYGSRCVCACIKYIYVRHRHVGKDRRLRPGTRRCW